MQSFAIHAILNPIADANPKSVCRFGAHPETEMIQGERTL
jgi:hypothetical protein